MPWKVAALSVQRAAFLTDVSEGRSVTDAAALHGVSRKTGQKWLKRYRDNPLAPLCDRSRKPAHSPLRTSPLVENAVLELRDRFGWGPQKIHDYYRLNPLPMALPSQRTCANILVRHNRILQPATSPTPPLSFQRSFPNQLWQFDFKGPIEIERQRIYFFVVLDDHSRYLLALRICLNKTTLTAWDVLWALFALYGLPDAVLCDNAFSAQRIDGLRTLSWIEMCLIRAGVKPLHGRPYHPQTQGKVERLNGTLEQEFLPRARTSQLVQFETDSNLWRSTVYNTLRPNEALGGRTPSSVWMPASKIRPAKLPEIAYPEGATLRKVGAGGDLSWGGYRILGGQGLAGQWVRLAESDHDLEIFYGDYALRKIPLETLARGITL